MNIEQANAVPISVLFDKHNIKPARTSGHHLYYLAFWRNEKTASVHVDTRKNIWYDHGAGEGGDTVKLGRTILASRNEPDTVSDALRYIAGLSGNVVYLPPVIHSEPEQEDKRLVIKNIRVVQHFALTHYLDARCIPLTTARKYLRELHLYNRLSKKYFFALGFKNDEDGYELRNELYKGNIGGKDITFLRGSQEDQTRVHVFEGFMDYLSIVAGEKTESLKDDAIVLNSVSLLKKATPYIQGYGYKVAYSWLDNDKAGMTAKQSLGDFCQTQYKLRHVPMNFLYKNYKDVNDWRVHSLKHGQ